MIDGVSQALTGLQAATKKLADASERIAGATTEGSTVDLAAEAVNVMVAKAAFKANIAMLETSREISEEITRLFDKRV